MVQKADKGARNRDYPLRSFRRTECSLSARLVTYDMLKVDFNSRRSVASFLYKWNNRGWFGEHELVETFSKKNLSGLKSEQDKIELLIGEWLLIDGLLPITKSPTSAGANAKSDWTQGHADHDRECYRGASDLSHQTCVSQNHSGRFVTCQGARVTDSKRNYRG